jgi:hypothetical protein
MFVASEKFDDDVAVMVIVILGKYGAKLWMGFIWLRMD